MDCSPGYRIHVPLDLSADVVEIAIALVDIPSESHHEQEIADLVEAADSELNAELTGKLSTTMMKLGRIKTAAEAGFSYDQMLSQGSDAGEALVMGGVDALVDQTRSIERAVAALELDGVAIEGSDSLDNPTAVFE